MIEITLNMFHENLEHHYASRFYARFPLKRIWRISWFAKAIIGFQNIQLSILHKGMHFPKTSIASFYTNSEYC